MRTFLKDIFEYHNHFNQRLLTELKVHLAVLPEKTFPLFCHVLNAHQIWNARILNVDPFSVYQVHSFETCSLIDDTNKRSTLQIVKTMDLEQTIVYKTSKGKEFRNQIKDILFHVANHSTHHKGQIIAHFRQAGVEPIVTDYIFYKR